MTNNTRVKAIVIGTIYTTIGAINMYFGYQALKQQKRFRDLKTDLERQHQVRFAGVASQELINKLDSMDPISMDELEGRCYTETLTEDEVPEDIFERYKRRVNE